MSRPDKYHSYSELRHHEEEGNDYRIHLRQGRSGIAVLAPHGGDIEPGTSEIADAVALDEHSFYNFEGCKRRGNWSLHIPSIHFDEPRCMRLIVYSRTVLTLHGCKGKEKIVHLGGLDENLKDEVEKALESAGFSTGERYGLEGKNRHNICNQSARGMGVQLEITTGLRSAMFEDLTRQGRKTTTGVFERFAQALRSVLRLPFGV